MNSHKVLCTHLFRGTDISRFGRHFSRFYRLSSLRLPVDSIANWVFRSPNNSKSKPTHFIKGGLIRTMTVWLPHKGRRAMKRREAWCERSAQLPNPNKERAFETSSELSENPSHNPAKVQFICLLLVTWIIGAQSPIFFFFYSILSSCTIFSWWILAWKSQLRPLLGENLQSHSLLLENGNLNLIENV